MAKLKKATRARKAASTPGADLQAKAEQMSRSIVDSAQQIWMAGMGAFNRAQGEGSKLFEALVKEGMSIENSTRKLAGGHVDAVRDAVEDRVGVVRGRAVDTWDRLEKVFEDRVQRALTRLGVPGREDLAELTVRVNELTRELRRTGKPAATPAARKVVVRSVAPRKAASAKGTTAKGAVPKARLPRAPRPVAPKAR